MSEQEQNTAAEEKDDRASRRGCPMSCFTSLAVLAFFFCLIVIGLPMAIRIWIRQNMSPAQLAEMEVYRRKPVTLPKSWQETPPFARDLLESDVRLRAIMDAQSIRIIKDMDTTPVASGLKDLQAGRTIAEDQWSSISALVAFSGPLLDETSVGVRLSGYELEARTDARTINYLSTQLNAQLWVLAAHEHARNAEWQLALESATMPVLRAQRHPASTFIGHLIGLAIENIGVLAINLLAGKCTDAAVLEKTLHELNQCDSSLHHDVIDDTVALDAIAQLRRYKRLGYPVSLTSGKPAVYYFNQHWRAMYDFPKWMLKRLPPGDPSRTYYESDLTSLASRTGLPWASGTTMKILTYAAPDMLYRLAQPNYLEASIREKATKARFDLTRLHLAARIRELRGQPVLNDTKLFVPAYLQGEPTDPFSGIRLSWEAGSSRFYSVGPDKLEDKVKIRYDPTNGTLSKGDICVQ